jgi:ATP-binding cassette subfamily F protein uup
VNIVTVENIAKSFGERQLFAGISFGISKGQKIAFIARNGVGKTTLLNILAGEDVPDQGQVIMRKGLRVAYLPQNIKLDPSLSIEQTILSTDNPVLKIIDEYEKALLNPDDEVAFQQAFDAMDRHEAWDFETQYKQILSRLRLDDLSQKTGTLSGGQQKRLSLAIALLQNPDLLILDEPTNHLDIEMIEWLEKYLQDTKLSLFMVTHDRYFLERVCDEIIELDRGKIYKYTGNYSYFLEKKEARIAVEKASIEKAKNLYRKELDWMRRTPMARTSKAKYRINAFDRIEENAKKRIDEKQINLEINIQRLGSKIVELHNVSKTFDNKEVIKQFSYVFKRGEKLGIVGKNGSGKSTLLNLITGKIKPDSGKVVIGETVHFGYYSQQGIEIKPGQKVIEVIREY